MEIIYLVTHLIMLFSTLGIFYTCFTIRIDTDQVDDCAGKRNTRSW